MVKYNYNKTNWIGGKTIGTADVMNNLEEGVFQAHEKLGEVDLQLEQIENNIVIINTNMSINEINNNLKKSGTFIFKNGIYLLNDENEKIKPSSNSRLIFEPNAILKYNKNTSNGYQMLEINNVENVIVEDVTIIGCKVTHEGSTGELGYGLEITSSKNIKIVRPKISKCWGDGIYIGYKWSITEKKFTTKNIEIYNPIINDCRRNGISVCSGDDITIENPKIYNIKGIAPQAGIDIEPENENKSIIHLNNLKIINPITENCGIGIGITSSMVDNATVEITRHSDYMSITSFQYTSNPNDNWNVKYNEPILYPKRGGIYLTNKGLNGILTINDVKFIGKGETPASADYLYDSAINISNSKNNNNNIFISNVQIDTRSTVAKFPFSLSLTTESGFVNDNVKIENFYCYEKSPMRVVNNGNLVLKNVNNEFVSNYYRLAFSGSNFFQKHTYDNLSSWDTLLEIKETLPDGKYNVCVETSSNTNMYVKLQKDSTITAYPTNANYWLYFGETEFVKKGNNIYFVKLPTKGKFEDEA